MVSSPGRCSLIWISWFVEPRKGTSFGSSSKALCSSDFTQSLLPNSSTLSYKLSKHGTLVHPPKHLTKEPRGKVRKLKSISRNSFPTWAYKTLFLDLLTKSLTLTFLELLQLSSSVWDWAMSLESSTITLRSRVTRSMVSCTGKKTSVKGVLESNECLSRCKT